MLYLMMTVDASRCAIDVATVIEVVPLVDITPLPGTPDAVAGLLTYRGAPVPVVDLSRLVAGRQSARRMSTRVILVKYPDGRGGTRPLGLLAERVTRTIRREAGTFVDPGVDRRGGALAGPVATDEDGVIHWIDPASLLPAAVRAALFTDRVAMS